MGKRVKLKKYTAMAVWLNVRPELRASNGSQQFSICIRVPTKKKVCEILKFMGCYGLTLGYLNRQHGLTENPNYSFEPLIDEEVYFHNENSGTEQFGDWLRLSEWMRIK